MGFADWIFGRKKGYPIHLEGVYKREEEENGRLTMMFKPDEMGEIDWIGELWHSQNRNIFDTGRSGGGKSFLLEALENEVTDPAECVKYGIEPQNVVIFSPKRFDDDEPIDFDLGRGKFVDCSKSMINVFEDVDAFVSAVEVMTSNIKSVGIMASHIGELAGSVARLNPCQSWSDFEKNLEKMKKNRNNNFSNAELDYLKDKIQYLKVDSTISDIPIEDVIFYLGNLNIKSRPFYYEVFLQKFARELNSKKVVRKPILILDEMHLIARNESSIISRYLRELRTRVTALWCASQNFDDIDPQLLQFEKMPTFGTHNLDPFASKPTLRDCIAGLENVDVPNNVFIDFADTRTDVVPVYKVSDEYAKKLEEIKQRALQKRIVERQEQETVLKEDIPEKAKPDEKENLEEKIIEVLEKNGVALYGYEIARKIGFSPKDAVKIRQVLRKIKDVKIREWKCQIRNEEVVYYYLINDGRDVCHNFMMINSKKKIVNAGWKIEFENTQGRSGADLIIERNGIKIAIENETFLKKNASDLLDRVAENRVKQIEALIVVSTVDAKAFYEQMFDCKIIGLWKLEECLKNWT